MLTPVTAEVDRARFCEMPGGAPLSANALAESGADASWILDADDAIRARCSLWWTAIPSYDGHQVGLIGHYAARDTAAGTALLRHACDELAAHGRTLAVGPMDGDSHHAYRLVTERGVEPLFFLEPDTPDAYPTQWTAAGFAPLLNYVSVLQSDLRQDRTGINPRMPAIASRLAARGVRVRTVDFAHHEADLHRIYGLVRASFRDNPFFAPLPEAEFAAHYHRLDPFVIADLVLLAECEDRLVGMLLAVPDWLQAQRGEPMTAVILKTLTVLPEYTGTGLAGLLIERGREMARALGYTRVIHALMHERNASLRLSARYADRVMRRYSLFARKLGSSA